MSSPFEHRLTRRRFLRAGGTAAAAGALTGLGFGGRALAAAPTQGTRAAKPPTRRPGTLPYPGLPAGQYTGALPFDHVVVVMQENHSFDNYLGMLPICGQPKADGFTFNRRGEPINWNPLDGQRMYMFHMGSEIGASDSGSQSWTDSHRQINGGRMDGFAATGPGSMGYYTEDDLPFYYSLARTFTLANRWFCSVPAQTYPNRRFLQAGTASGIVSTDISNITTYPANGTVFDQLSRFGIPWLNYFSDAPTTGIIVDTDFRYPQHLARIEQFYADAAAGALPAVSIVDCNMGAVQGEVASVPEALPAPIPTFTAVPDRAVETTCESEEAPEDVQLGEAFVSRIVNAVMSGPAWQRTVLVWLYDEHGGYYDHVPPPAAVAPDAIPPGLGPDEPSGGYDLYGPRVPAVVVSPYSRRNDVTNVVHDHTSVLATIEAMWNLPALTYRDANAATIADFFDLRYMQFAEPPELARPADATAGLVSDYQNGQPQPPTPAASTPNGGTAPAH